MKNIDTYITEKLHLNGDNKNLVSKDIDVGDFIDSVEGDYQKRVVKLLDKAIKHIKENPTVTCFIVKSTFKHNGVELPEYKWAESKSGKTFNIGDKTPKGSTIVYEVTNKTEIPSYWSALYLNEGLVSEKLHLNGDNKNLTPKAIDAGDFIESFRDKEERRWITRLVGWCVKHIDRKIDDHECYVVEYIKDKQSGSHTVAGTPSDKFGWTDNTSHEHHEVGDVEEYGNTKYKIIFIVTKDTIIPDKYKS